MESTRNKKVATIKSLIGNTPLLAIDYSIRGWEGSWTPGDYIYARLDELRAYRPDINLSSFEVFKRTCNTCCVPSECIEKDYIPDNGSYHLHNCPKRTGNSCNSC